MMEGLDNSLEAPFNRSTNPGHKDSSQIYPRQAASSEYHHFKGYDFCVWFGEDTNFQTKALA
jgi:hypothetical protein